MRRFLLASLVLAFALTRWAGSAVAADPDTTPPTILSAIKYSTNNDAAPYVIWLGFSERMASNTVFEPTNYQIRSLTGNLKVNVLDVDYQPGVKTTQNILLITDDVIDFTKDWVLTAFNVADTNGNITLSNRVNLTLVESVVNPQQEYAYLDKGRYADLGDSRFDSHRQFNQEWIKPTYDDLEWGYAASVFYIGAGGTPPTYGNKTLCCYFEGDIEQASKTAYFRTTFQSQGSLFNSVWQMRYLLADGAVMYLNGQEVWRTNISAAVTKPDYNTLANRAGSLGWTANYLTLPSTFNDLVRTGTNYLAIEVHNNGVADNILGFGLDLVQRYTNHIGGRLQIVQSPSDVTNAVEGTITKFEVKPDGAPPFRYQWNLISKANVTNAIAGATNRILALDTLLTQDGSKVFCRVTGGSPSTSSNSASALLLVRPDTNAPAILAAQYDPTAGGIVVDFSEGMKLSSMTNKANYTITNHLGAVIPVTGASAIDETSVVLFTANPPTLAERWVVRTQNLTDNASAANPLSTLVAAVVGGVYTVIPFESTWRFFQDATNPPVTTNWIKSDYVEVGNWESGAGLFGFEDVPPRFINTPLFKLGPSGNQTITYYFRNTFDFGGPTNNLIFNLQHIVDDGMVIWLNGTIVFRYNMSGTPNYNSLATADVGDAVLVDAGRINAFVPALIQGKNQLAVEVHQNSATSSDLLFDMQLTVTNTPYLLTNTAPVVPPTLTITAPANNSSVVQGATVTINADATAAAGATISKVEFFDGTTSLGSDTAAPYSGSLVTTLATTVGDHTIRVVATDSKSASTTNSIVVKVTAALPPTLVIDAPANNTTVAQGDTVAINATATAAAGATISKVDFFDGATSLGSDTAAPYTANFATTGATAVGDHTIRVIATDSKSLSTTNSIIVKVIAPATPPAVVITAPTAGANVAQGTSVTVNATATAGVGATITKVEFFDGLTSLGVDTTAPYSANFATAAATALGDHTLRAVATDSKGQTGQATVVVKVVAPTSVKLTVALSADGKNVLISWPAAPGFVLESSTQASPTSWSVIANATSPVAVPVVSGGVSKYYRLRLQ